MTVDPQAILEMNRIIQAMNNGIDLGDAADDDFVDGDDLYEDAAPPAYMPSVSAGSVDEMKKILEAFNGAVVDGSVVNDPEVREALEIEPTPRGARIGSWEIVKHEGATARYDVVGSETGIAIARDLYLYDAARGLVRALNEGVSITDARVRDLLKLEEDFARNRDDAVSYRTRARKLRESADEQRAAVAEDRGDEAERQAEAARDRILHLAGLRS